MHLIRFMCMKHDVDLECIDTNTDGNPENPLYAIRYDLGDPHKGIDNDLATRAGIIDSGGEVLKLGTYYAFDHSSFACPSQGELPDDLSREEEEELYCSSKWTVLVDEVR